MAVRIVRLALVLALAGIVTTTALHAQDDDAEDKVSFTIDAGLAATSGNSDITTITAGQTFGYQAGAFLLSQGFDMLTRGEAARFVVAGDDDG